MLLAALTRARAKSILSSGSYGPLLSSPVLPSFFDAPYGIDALETPRLLRAGIGRLVSNM